MHGLIIKQGEKLFWILASLQTLHIDVDYRFHNFNLVKIRVNYIYNLIMVKYSSHHNHNLLNKNN